MTAISVTEPDGSTDVVIGAGETVVFWNRRSDVSNVGTVENFRANYYIDDDVHIVVTNYGKDWATSGYFALQAKSTGTIFSDYTYVNGTIDKTDGGDMASVLILRFRILDWLYLRQRRKHMPAPAMYIPSSAVAIPPLRQAPADCTLRRFTRMTVIVPLCTEPAMT